MSDTTKQLLQQYYQAFNAGDMKGFVDLLSDDVIHDINQGVSEVGKHRFGQFMEHMNCCYKEEVSKLVIMVSADGSRAAAEFMITGKYLRTDGDLPAANGQTYSLPVGTFFTVHEGKIKRVTNYYNLQDWLKQING
jgi:steroid delta-isomerase-like uncharacterized protein